MSKPDASMLNLQRSHRKRKRWKSKQTSADPSKIDMMLKVMSCTIILQFPETLLLLTLLSELVLQPNVTVTDNIMAERNRDRGMSGDEP